MLVPFGRAVVEEVEVVEAAVEAVAVEAARLAVRCVRVPPARAVGQRNLGPKSQRVPPAPAVPGHCLLQARQSQAWLRWEKFLIFLP